MLKSKIIKLNKKLRFAEVSYFLAYIFSIIFIIPYVITFTSSIFIKTDENNIVSYLDNNLSNSTNDDFLEVINDLNINNNLDEINMNNTDNINNLNNINNFENYILGVVGAEMPISFHVEALKAQAVAARTYAYKRIDDVNQVVDHTSIGQAFDSIDSLKSKWGISFNEYYNKLYMAIYDTQGIIMTYDNEPIEAVFHSTSAGITELSENIWGANLPYITNVDSKVDEQAPNFMYTTTVKNTEIIEKISSQYPNIETSNIISSFQILERSDADYILSIQVDNTQISGRDIRTMFGLRSTNFTIVKNEDSISFTTKGYGHGAGMSQYGANFMAEDGSTYEEILNHYYNGILLEKKY